MIDFLYINCHRSCCVVANQRSCLHTITFYSIDISSLFFVPLSFPLFVTPSSSPLFVILHFYLPTYLPTYLTVLPLAHSFFHPKNPFQKQKTSTHSKTIDDHQVKVQRSKANANAKNQKAKTKARLDGCSIHASLETKLSSPPSPKNRNT
jgi:hypothetical protein